MATFVLVHGAWGGAHGFGKVRRLLAAGGHEVFTPSLTGIGERAHLTGPQVGLSTHIADVVNTILYEDLDDIVLVGFSYGGFVVTGALAHIATRVRHLVYLDAFVPNDGDSVSSVTGIEVDEVGPGAAFLVPPRPREYEDPERGAWAELRRVGQPGRCFVEPIRLERPLEGHAFTLTYIKATGDPRTGPDDPFWAADDRAQASDRWSRHTIDTNHMVADNRPEALVAILEQVVGADSSA